MLSLSGFFQTGKPPREVVRLRWWSFFSILLFTFFLVIPCAAPGQDISFDDLLNASSAPDIPVLATATTPLAPPPQPPGSFELTVETVRERTPNRIAMMAVRVEVWRGDRPLACLEKGDAGVEEEFRRRRFTFPPISLPKGYHFITVRAFAEGPISREKKWKGDTFQIGIEPGKTVKVTRTVSFFVW